MDIEDLKPPDLTRGPRCDDEVVPKHKRNARFKPRTNACTAPSFLPETKRVYVRTFGCAHNASDSEYMAGVLAAEGYDVSANSNDAASADAWVINSCTVKDPSQSAFMHIVNSAKSLDKPLVVAGCVPQADRKLKGLEEVRAAARFNHSSAYTFMIENYYYYDRKYQIELNMEEFARESLRLDLPKIKYLLAIRLPREKKEESMKLLTEAASAGFLDAQVELAQRFDLMDRKEEAVRFYRMAVDGGRLDVLKACEALEAKLFMEWYVPKNLSKKKSFVFNKKLSSEIKYLLSQLKLKNDTFVHRDFHVSNLMKVKKKIGILDSQDAVIGNKAYDLASLIDDVRLRTSKQIKKSVYNFYIDLNKNKINKIYFKNDFEILSVLRNLKIIGIFTRLAIRDNKKKYLKMIPLAWELIETRINNNIIFHNLKKNLDNNFSTKCRIKK